MEEMEEVEMGEVGEGLVGSAVVKAGSAAVQIPSRL